MWRLVSCYNDIIYNSNRWFDALKFFPEKNVPRGIILSCCFHSRAWDWSIIWTVSCLCYTLTTVSFYNNNFLNEMFVSHFFFLSLSLSLVRFPERKDDESIWWLYRFCVSSWKDVTFFLLFRWRVDWFKINHRFFFGEGKI